MAPKKTTTSTISISAFIRCDCDASIDLGALVDHVVCRRCLQKSALSPQRWEELLDAAVHDLPRMKPGSEVTRDVERASANGRVVATNTTTPTCASCKTPIAIEAIERACANGSGSYTCASSTCGAKLSLRSVPSSLASVLPGITHVLGEDIRQLADPRVAPPSVNVAEGAIATCPSCGAGLKVDGRTREVVCAYCKSMVVLPIDISERMGYSHDEPHVFYLVHDDALPRAARRADFYWRSVRSIAGDQDGNVYVLGEDEDAFGAVVVFALDAQLRTKWLRRDLKALDRESRIAWQPATSSTSSTTNGPTLLVWNTQRASAVLLRCEDGSDAGKIGGKQPPDSEVHTLDLEQATALAVDHVDGSVIFAKEQRLVRCSADGTGIPIWPPRKGFLWGTIEAKPSPFTGPPSSTPKLEAIDDYPTEIYRVRELLVGWDGCLYVSEGHDLAAFERTGKKKYVVQLPDEHRTIDVAVDASGVAYVMQHDADDTASIFRVAANGSFERLVDGSDTKSTPLRDDGKLLLRPTDGTILVLGSNRSVRVFSTDGELLSRNEGAKANDAEYAQEHDDDDEDDD